MTDDNTLDSRAGEGIVALPEGGRNATDPTPAEPAQAVDEAVGDDHSAWRRPESGAPRRTSEVVGALSDDTLPPVHSLSRASGARRAMPPGERAAQQAAEQAAAEQPDAGQGDAPQTADLPPEHMAAVIGARAALERDRTPGVSLDHEPDVVAPESRPQRPLWLRLLPWLAGILALALVVGGIVFATTRKPEVIVTQTPTPSATTTPPVTDANLMDVAQAKLVDAKQTWAAGPVLDRLATDSPRIFCLSNTTGQPNPQITRQRTLTTTSATGLSARHQIDAYATVAEATAAFTARATQLATCSDVPTWLAGADKITGLGDQATSVTLAYQDVATQYHTVILSRTGTVLDAVDVIQANQGVAAAKVLPAAAAIVNEQCKTSHGACARAADSSPSGPAPTGIPGWLVVSDIPRVSPGAGLWSSTDTSTVTTKGSGCENVTLSAAQGATKSEQRTYLMTQDNAAPQNFGMDEVLLTFPNAQAAQAFAKTLSGNLAGCTKRINTAKITDAQNASITIDGSNLQTQTQLTTLSMGGSAALRFRTAVVVNGAHVVYLVNNPSDSYDLGKDKFLQVALRAGQRAGQTS